MNKIGSLCVSFAIVMTLVLPGVSLARGGASVGRVELAFVEAVDVSRGTLVVAGETYRVDRRSRLAGADGEPIGLSELKLPDGVILGDRVEMDVSVGDGRRRLVRSLRVLSEPLP